MSRSDRRVVDVVAAALLSGLTLTLAVYFAPRGFNAGFVDMAHDGYQLRQALDLFNGGTLFRDTFDQYGLLTPLFNQIGFRTLGQNLLAIKYFVALWYGATAVAMYALARQFLAPALSVFSVVLWLALAPFYQHGIMLSPHAYVLLFQAAAIIVIVNDKGGERWRWCLAGVLCGVCWLFKQSLGSLFFAALALHLISTARAERQKLRPAFRRLADLTFGFAAVIGGSLLWLLVSGSLHDWYLQTIVFPTAFYLSYYPDQTPGELPGLSLARLFVNLHAGAAGYWLVLRAVVIIGGVVALSRREPEGSKLILAAWVTLLLWLAAFPSANYMHQWWTISLSLCAAVYVVQAAIDAVMKPARRFGHAPTAVATVMVIGFVAWPGIVTRWNDGWGRVRTPSELIGEPSALRGMRTDAVVHRSVTAIYETMVKFRSNHPGASIVSIDSHEGVSDNAESLLLLSFFEHNPHPGPVYWNLPVLSSSVYPAHQSGFERFVKDQHPLIVDYQNRGDAARVVPDYYLLAAEPTSNGTWFVYAPQHPESTAHGELALDPPSVAVLAPTAAPPVPTMTVIVDGRSVQARVYAASTSAAVAPADLTTLLDGVEAPANATPEVLQLAPRVVVAGSAAAPDSYLFQLKERSLKAGDAFAAVGNLDEGGITVGLQRNGLWAGYLNITEPGPFVVVVRAPEDGRYTLTVANCVTAPAWSARFNRHGLIGAMRGWLQSTLPNSFQLEKTGWLDAR